MQGQPTGGCDSLLQRSQRELGRDVRGGWPANAHPEAPNAYAARVEQGKGGGTVFPVW